MNLALQDYHSPKKENITDLRSQRERIAQQYSALVHSLRDLRQSGQPSKHVDPHQVVNAMWEEPDHMFSPIPNDFKRSSTVSGSEQYERIESRLKAKKDISNLEYENTLKSRPKSKSNVHPGVKVVSKDTPLHPTWGTVHKSEKFQQTQSTLGAFFNTPDAPKPTYLKPAENSRRKQIADKAAEKVKLNVGKHTPGDYGKSRFAPPPIKEPLKVDKTFVPKCASALKTKRTKRDLLEEMRKAEEGRRAGGAVTFK